PQQTSLRPHTRDTRTLAPSAFRRNVEQLSTGRLRGLSPRQGRCRGPPLTRPPDGLGQDNLAPGGNCGSQTTNSGHGELFKVCDERLV
ncbi:MAG: hypothetical protein OXC62_12345, partial [Aestuariivita sp.]|nr:hypothetical protein [Aestuariivita sp.]